MEAPPFMQRSRTRSQLPPIAASRPCVRPRANGRHRAPHARSAHPPWSCAPPSRSVSPRKTWQRSAGSLPLTGPGDVGTRREVAAGSVTVAGMEEKDRSSSSTWQALQHIFGISTGDVGGGLGAVLASAWFWTARRGPLSDWGPLPSERPVDWAGRATRSLGLDGKWADQVGHWLLTHGPVFWVLVAVAVLASGRIARGHNSALLSVAVLALLAAASTRTPGQAFMSFTVSSAMVAGLGVLVDTINRLQHHPRRPAWSELVANSIALWAAGPGRLLGAAVFTPAIVVWWAACDYRFRKPVDRSEIGHDLAREAEQLIDTPLFEVSSGRALRYLAAVLLLQSETGHHRPEALRHLVRRMTAPTGARILRG